MTDVPQSLPIACRLAPAQLNDRRARWAELARRALRSRAQVPQGVRLRFDDEPGAAGELEDLVDLERSCCAFAGWTIVRRPGGVILTVTAQDEMGIEAVRELFADLPGAG
jgi:hypothetical protein